MPLLTHPAKASVGDRIAILSPSFAAPGAFPAIHEQAMARFTAETGLVGVEYPTTRQLGASAQARARDLNAAFADPTIRGIVATIGGDDQITVIPHLDADAARRDPKPFVGYSDNTHLHSWLWANGVASFYGGSTQVHWGPGPGVDDIQVASLRAALLTGETLELTQPPESEDHGIDWGDPAALTTFGVREPTEPWTWHGPTRRVEGLTWGGCLESLQGVLGADRFPFPPAALAGAILLIETSELTPSADEVRRMLTVLGERGLLEPVAGVLAAQPPRASFERPLSAAAKAEERARQRDITVATIARYNPDAVVCVGVPFGHTRPQWIVPHGGRMVLDAPTRRVYADYS